MEVAKTKINLKVCQAIEEKQNLKTWSEITKYMNRHED